MSASAFCFHCDQPIGAGVHITKHIDGADRSFCCHGCANVCEVIYESGLSSYYERTPEGQLLAPPPPPPKDMELYDFDEVQSEYVDSITQDVRSINLMAEGIHCAACVWLIEHRLAQNPAVKSAKVNFTNKRITLKWDNSSIKLSSLLADLSKIGYKATPFNAEMSIQASKKANRDLLYRLGFAGFAMMNVMWFAVAMYAGAIEQDPEIGQFFKYLGLAIATPTLLYSGWPFLSKAYKVLKARHLDMDVSISLGLLTTYFYSFYITFWVPEGEVYFDTLVDLVFLLLIGRYLEAISKLKAVDATRRLMDLQPKVARLWQNDQEVITPVQRLKPGQVVLVKAGDQFPVDGVILQGETEVDESMLSGESREVVKRQGDRVSAGTHNKQSSVMVTIEALLQDTALGKIVQLVEEAQGSKAPMQKLSDRVMPYFVSITISIALGSFLYWYFALDLHTAIMAGTSVLIITCPCAFGLATPMAIAVAAGVASRYGILIKDGATLENLQGIDHVVLDKTGTLTEGKMNLLAYESFGSLTPADLLALAATLEYRSEHSLAAAVVRGARQAQLEFKHHQGQISSFKVIAGKGIEVAFNGHNYVLGHQAWLTEKGFTLQKSWQERIHHFEIQGATVILLASEQQVLGLLALADNPRPSASVLVQWLKSQNIPMTMLTGDSQTVAEFVANSLGGMAVKAQVLPAEKDAFIQSLQAQGHRVMFVGDGVNDAPALVRADIGVALGSGVDASMDSADVVLLNADLSDIPVAYELSQATLRTVKQNIASSFAYNTLMVPLAATAVLTPVVAAITMPLSSLVVIGNSARLKSFKPSIHKNSTTTSL